MHRIGQHLQHKCSWIYCKEGLIISINTCLLSDSQQYLFLAMQLFIWIKGWGAKDLIDLNHCYPHTSVHINEKNSFSITELVSEFSAWLNCVDYINCEGSHIFLYINDFDWKNRCRSGKTLFFKTLLPPAPQYLVCPAQQCYRKGGKWIGLAW